ncbi:MAG TPA: hypothetical protein VMH34_06580 [Gammaproteobacteria bacterium]|nr:hypothetical protein [Gammaproteobacteria bacterium]
MDIWTNAGYITGRWQNKEVGARCRQGGDGFRTWEICDVVVGGEFAGELNFSK